MRSAHAAIARIAFALALVAIAVPRPAWCAWPHSLYTNVQIAPAAGNQTAPTSTPDGAGGVIIAWYDDRNGNNDIFAQHITALGIVAAGWPASGLAICTAADDQSYPVIVSDGAGGALIAWQDKRNGNYDTYAIRVAGNGTFPGGWPANGVRLTSNTHDEQLPVIVSDGASGAFVAWTLVFTFPTDLDIYDARVNSSGTVVFSGSVSAPTGIQDRPAMVADGSGGAILCWDDNFAGNYDIKATRQNSTGATTWGPVTVSNAVSDQVAPLAASDGAGGALFGWTDYRFGNADVFASRFTSGGAVAPGWSVLGNAACVLPNIQTLGAVLSDGVGGMFLVWQDLRSGVQYDLYAQRISSAGTPSIGWQATGNPLSTGNADHDAPVLASDGSGGAIVGWRDARAGLHPWATRVTAGGAQAPGWPYNGTPLSAAGPNQGVPIALVPDGAGGAIAAWPDFRTATANIFAQNVDRFGQLGDARPSIVSVRDVAADQGGHVRMVWNASYLDADPGYAIGSYWIWRQTPSTLAMQAVRRGAAWLDDAPDRTPEALAREGHRVFRRAEVEAAAYAWEFVASPPATGFAQYSYVAPTTTDSLGGHNPYTVFMVEARFGPGIAFWDSAPDSGYSVDNLPPFAPAPFTAAYAGGATHLHWGANLESDFAVYRLYRGASSGFVPGPGNLVTEQPDTGFADPGAAGSWYKLAAVDAHGNVSVYVVLGPSGTTGVDQDLPTVLSLGPPAPNPSQDGVAFEIALPRNAWVRAGIFDVLGRRVRELADGNFQAGRIPLRWDGLDQAGRRVSDGLYIVRMDAEGRSLTRRLTVVR